MNLRLFDIVIALILGICLSVSAQERTRAEEVLRYFPAGDYRGINHKDHRPQPDSPGIEHWRWYQDAYRKQFDMGKGRRSFLPVRFDEQEHTLTSARLNNRIVKTVRVKIEQPYGHKELERAYETLRENNPGMEAVRKQILVDKENDIFEVDIVIELGDSLFVYYCDVLIDLIPQALKSGELVVSDETIRKQPVYRMKVPPVLSRSDGLFCYLTPFGEMLMAKTPGGIKTMLDVAEGAVPNIMEDPRYAALAEVLPELSIEWALAFPQSRERIELDQEIKNGLREDRAELMEADLKHQALVWIATFEASDTLIAKQISVYADEEVARKAYDSRPSWKSFNPVTGKVSKVSKFREYEQSRTTIKIDGNWIIESTVYDKEYLEKRFDRYRESKKIREEQEAKRKAEQKDKQE